MRKTLTARFVGSGKAVPESGRKDWRDAVVPGLSLRVSANGHKSYVLIARFPMHPKHPTRRALGNGLTLEAAREKARRWLALIDRGIDPKIQEARERAAALRAQRGSFEAVWQEFCERHASRLARKSEVERAGTAFRRLFGARPAAEIDPAEIASYIRRVAQETPAEARNRLGHLRRMYSWAIGTGEFGLVANPCASLKPTDLIGRKVARDRILSDAELRAVWGACGALGYPYGPLIRLMLLTGQRERECAGMTLGEVDFGQALWTIPAARMKSDRVHVVPLAPEALALLRSLPRFTGPFVFTTRDGRVAVNGFSAIKRRIDELNGVAGWVFHDIRRTMRSGLSALPIEDRVREAMIAHAQPGLHAVYNLYDWLAEKRRGFELWEARLRGILAPPPPAGVVDLAQARRSA
jgi:integrase